jgi:hypothetical protein
MGIRIRRSLLSLAIAAISSVGQESNLAGPVSGLLVDEESRSIRPILGVPGSAYAGEASVTEFDLAVAAPNGQHALISKGGSLYLIRRLDGATPVWRQLINESATFGRAAWSESSTSFAVVNATTSRLELWTDLAKDPRQAVAIDTSSLSGRIVYLAVDQDASFAFAATQGLDGGALFLLKAGQEPRMILPLGKAGGLLLSGEELYVTDRGRNEVLRVTNWASNPAVATIASAGHGVNDPVGAALSGDRKTLYIASAGVNQVLGLDVASSAVKSALDLEFQPTRLERLGSGSLLLLEKGIPGESPAQVLDSATQKVYFVPVSAAAGE